MDQWKCMMWFYNQTIIMRRYSWRCLYVWHDMEWTCTVDYIWIYLDPNKFNSNSTSVQCSNACGVTNRKVTSPSFIPESSEIINMIFLFKNPNNVRGQCSSVHSSSEIMNSAQMHLEWQNRFCSSVFKPMRICSFTYNHVSCYMNSVRYNN